MHLNMQKLNNPRIGLLSLRDLLDYCGFVLRVYMDHLLRDGIRIIAIVGS